MAQTAVEWLQEKYNSRQVYEESIFDEEFEQAKAMEKEQIEEAYVDGFLDGGENIYNIGIYYNKKYTNGL
jgi:hypothetical protein